MKYLEYMESHDGENFSWCKPYTDGNEERFLIMYDGIANSIDTPDGVFYRFDGSDFDTALEALARNVNPDYDLFIGYNDQQLALIKMHEVGCSKCPFRYECDTMMEDVSDDDYK